LSRDWRANAALGSSGLRLRRLLGFLLGSDSLEVGLFLELLELLEALIGDMASSLLLLCSILLGLLFVQPGTVLKHLLDLLGMAVLRLLLLREWLARSAKLVGLSSASTKV
jgi:hypothetical protein